VTAPYARSPIAGGTTAALGASTTATEPTVYAEIEFTAGAWTDVSAYLRTATTKRGKERALDTVDPGTMVLTFGNATRRFDPEHATGPYYGNLAPGKGIRLRAVWGGYSYAIFTGFVDRLSQSYDRESPNDSTATFECSDGLAKLAAATLGSPLEVTMASESPAPSMWLRLGERSGPAAYDRSGNNRYGVYVDHSTFAHLVGEIGYGASSLLQHDNDTGVTFPAGVHTWIGTSPMADAAIAPFPWTLEFWFAGDLDPGPLGIEITYLVMPADAALTTVGSVRVYAEHGLYDVDGVTELDQRLVVSQWQGGTSAIVMAPTGFFDGEPHHVVVVGESGQPIRLYVDDVQYTLNQSGTAMALRAGVGFAIGNVFAGPGEFTIDEFMAWNDARDATERARISLAATGFAGETGNARITRILDHVGWPSANRNITTAFDTTLGGTPLATTALEHLRQIEQTIEGRLFMSEAGVLTLLGRNEHLVEPYITSQATFGDGAGEIGYTEMGDWTLDWSLLTNVVRRTNGESTVIASDAASIATYGRRDQTDVAEVESHYATQEFDQQLAAYRLEHYSEPVPHVEGLRILPRKEPATMWPIALGVGLNERVTFKRRPQDVGNPISREVVVEGVSHSLSAKRWETEFSIDAIGAQRYFLFDDTVWGEEEWRFAA
jgi:hypothetical protein